MRVSPPLLAFNRGLFSRLGLARTDIERTRLSASEQTNWIPSTLGSMTLRPGLEFIGEVKDSRPARFIPFVFEADDQALLEVTDRNLRVWIDGATLSRPAVHARVTNSGFKTNLNAWVDDDETGAASTWASGALALRGTGVQAAQRWQQVRVTDGERRTEHALRVIVSRGPVTLKVGSAPGSDNMLAATALGTGAHSLAFTPARGSFYVHVSHRGDYTALLDAIQLEAAGPLELHPPYGVADLPKLRWSQSRDVIFLACDGSQQRRIERRAARSWSVVVYETADGPFKPENFSRVTLEPSGLEGDVTLAASADVFRPTHVDTLFRLTSSGQKAAEAIAAEDVFTEAIRVTGVGDSRGFVVAKSGSGAAVVTLQRSVGEPGDWEDVQTVSAGSASIFDELDNQIIFYRVGVKVGDYTSGVVNVSITFARGAVDGVCRITSVRSARSAEAVVLKPFGQRQPTAIWAEGAWSRHDGWPTAVCLFEGRLWWGGRGRLWGSVSDAFDSFDVTIEGASGSIAKTISDGPSDLISWIAVGRRMALGAAGGVFEARASNLDDPLTPGACELRRFSTMGSADLPAVPVNERLHFVQRAGRELLEATASGVDSSQETIRLTAHAPEAGEAGFVRLAVQNQPEVRVHCLRQDGAAAVLVTDPNEEVRCWIVVETEGRIEDVVVLPTGAEDQVYYVVLRTIDGRPRRFLERWALAEDCRGGALNRQADSHVLYQGAPTDRIPGLDHLEGQSVVIWADGTARDEATVSNGAVDISGAPCQAAVVGLGYEARYQSVKLAYGARKGSALGQPKRVNRLSFVLADVHGEGLRYGPDFERLDPLPPRPAFGPPDKDTIYAEYDFDGTLFPGEWSVDARICLHAAAPKPCTVLGVVLDMETIEQ